MKTGYIDVDYFDSLNGGSGRTRMAREQLIEWLDAHPGYLIRKIQEC